MSSSPRGCEHALAQQAGPGDAGGALGADGRRGDEGVLRRVRGAETGGRAQVAQPPQDLFAAVAEGAQFAAGVRRQAAARRREVAERGLTRGPSVPQAKGRPHAAHRLVPAQLALAGERRQQGGRVGLRDGAELEQRVVVHLVGPAHLAQAEAAHVHGRVPGDDGDRRPGDAAARHHAGGELVERRESAPHGCGGRDTLRGGRQRGRAATGHGWSHRDRAGLGRRSEAR